MVTTVTETFFRQNFGCFGPKKFKSCNWLALRAANGLAIPYLGYIEVDIEVLGKVIPKQGVLVVKDPTDPVAIERKQLVPCSWAECVTAAMTHCTHTPHL